jgi:hypothetical protein
MNKQQIKQTQRNTRFLASNGPCWVEENPIQPIIVKLLVWFKNG